MESQQVLVTGGAGYRGTNLVNEPFAGACGSRGGSRQYGALRVCPGGCPEFPGAGTVL